MLTVMIIITISTNGWISVLGNLRTTQEKYYHHLPLKTVTIVEHRRNLISFQRVEKWLKILLKEC